MSAIASARCRGWRSGQRHVDPTRAVAHTFSYPGRRRRSVAHASVAGHPPAQRGELGVAPHRSWSQHSATAASAAASSSRAESTIYNWRRDPRRVRGFSWRSIVLTGDATDSRSSRRMPGLIRGVLFGRRCEHPDVHIAARVHVCRKTTHGRVAAADALARCAATQPIAILRATFRATAPSWRSSCRTPLSRV